MKVPRRSHGIVADPPIPTTRRDARRAPEEVVREGWNRLSLVYRPNRSHMDRTGHLNREYRDWLAPILRYLPNRSRVLDLGCGNGDPAARLLSGKFQLTGVDISDVQVRRARALVPGAQFHRADMTRVRFPLRSFAAVVVLYSLIHVPLRKQRPLLRRMNRWLAPGGLLLAIVGSTAWTGRESHWLGLKGEMYWSHTDASTYQHWLREMGFRVLRRRFIPEGESGHELFLVRKPAPRESVKRPRA